MHCGHVLICAVAIVAPVYARQPKKEVTVGCTRICSSFNKDHLVLEPKCHARCQADVYNCIENTLPPEETGGERILCIQEALMTRIREDGGIITKLTYDVSPNFEQFEELYNKDGRFDSRDMSVLKKIMASGKGSDGSTLPDAKVKVVMDAFKEADQDGDGVVTEGEFNAYAKDADHVAHKEEKIPDLPDLLQSNLRSPNLQQKKANRPQKKVEQSGEAYFQHLVHLGLSVERDEENRDDPIALLASTMYKSPGLKESL